MKIGAWRDEEGGWSFHRSPGFLCRSVEENLARLDLSRMDIVNLRLGAVPTSC